MNTQTEEVVREAELPEIVDVTCFVPADGRVAFILKQDVDGTEWKRWSDSLDDEQRDQHEAFRCFGGIVHIRMLKADYIALGASNRNWINA